MTDDKRMHGGNTPGMVGGRGRERHEEPVRLNHPEPGEDQPGTTGKAEMTDTTSDMEDLHQPSALGGETATRSAKERSSDDDG